MKAKPQAMAKVKQLRGAPWNYNVQSAAAFLRTVESIRKHDFCEPLTVRRVAGVAGWQIVAGEHRWRAAMELGIEEVPIFDLGEMDDSKAKLLAIVLNELEGSPDEVRLADLVRDINRGTSLEELSKVLPFSATSLDQLVKSVDFSFSNLMREDTRRPEGGQAVPPGPPAPSKGPEKKKGGGEPERKKRAAVGVLGVRVTVVRSRLAAVDPSPAAALLRLLDWWESERGGGTNAA